jgi:hypothetical protein
MRAVKRTRDTIDVLEHAMQGIHTSENRAPIQSFRADSGIVGMSSESEVHDLKVPELEREVIVNLPDRRRAAR